MFENIMDNLIVEKLYSWLKQKQNTFVLLWIVDKQFDKRSAGKWATKRCNSFLFSWLISFPKFSESYGMADSKKSSKNPCFCIWLVVCDKTLIKWKLILNTGLEYSKPRMFLLDWGSIHQAQSKWMKTWSEFFFLPFRFSTSETQHCSVTLFD